MSMHKQSCPTELLSLARIFEEAGFTLYGVGGMVRNPLLGFPVSDMDITSAMRPQAVQALCREKGIRCLPIGIAFGMVEVHVGQCKFEHTTFRADTYGPGGSHRPISISFSDTVEADAFRRDFTVNALYQSILSGELIDPTGGLEDINKRLLRTTSPEPGSIMQDDALRVLRLARFCAELGFDAQAQTFIAAKAHASGLADISNERVRDELNKILLSDTKYGISAEQSVYRGLAMLNALGALDVILPELTRGRGVTQRQEHHAYDVLEHCLHAAAAAEASGGLALRLAALLHDVGKPVSMERQGNMYGHDRFGAEIAQKILTRLRYSNAMIAQVTALIAGHMYDLDGRAKESTLRHKFVDWGYAPARMMAQLRRADVLGSGRDGSIETARRWDAVLDAMQQEGAPFDEAALAVTGEMLINELGIRPGPKVGRIKRSLLYHCAKRPQDNTKERLLRLARDMR